LYEIFDSQPHEFAQLNTTDIKRLYRDLSRKYHPDKNPDEDTTDKFMKLKLAFEILNDQEKRAAYDIYGQTDFSQDDKMKDMIEQRFKNKTDREE
jgi:DnaJ-class molecular chaperone